MNKVGEDSYMEHILLESNCGRAEQDTNYQHVLIGTNSRLSEFQSICNTIFSQVLYYVVEAGEESKSLENAQKIYICFL